MPRFLRVAGVCVLAVTLATGCDDGEDAPCDGVVCDYGVCDEDIGACVCDPGYAGERCDQCDIDCGPHGGCVLETATCACETGWTGDECETEILDCGDQGTFDADSGSCECDPGFAGDLCDDCDTGHTGDACDECDEGYVLDGDSCVEGVCVDDSECDDDDACNGVETCAENECVAGTPVDCGDHGICDAGACGCEAGWARVDDACLEELATFDDLTLEAETFWNGSDEAGSFTSGVVTFYNSYNTEWASWDGFAYSDVTDTTSPGFENQYACIAGAGADGSANYGVAYVSSFSTIGPPTFELDAAATIAGAYVTNATYPYISMRDGDDYSKQFGGDTGADPDWFLLTITGYSATGETTGTVEFYLADFRSDDATEDYIIDDWTWVDLSGLGEVLAVEFTLTSSDVGDWGMNTPAYFAIDSILR